ncbi:DUF3046 domain-containing protein [Actinomyces slackii]|uniref:Protein of uncharacterized function (DUF3046) n=1 Tax=Actinomyces slackii TaxID=52774 RepID=A0A448KD43_9ACTO|nr:DUF3046 domain-containing protein [Actinomyces slackii]VEG74854.1 Protein of uncharacterised function (DUF3046) [Actinomyces slackii]
MKHSEFWAAVETVFGAAHGRSLVQDLVLGPWGRTGAQALEAGVAPREVWSALCDETGRSEAERWVIRIDPPRRGSGSPGTCG